MQTAAIIGAQWGDEGKGKLTDLLAAKSDLVVRYQTLQEGEGEEHRHRGRSR